MAADDLESAVLVDAMAFARTLGCVHRDFTILEFLDLCSAIEAVVLNDRIVLLDVTSSLVEAHEELAALDAEGFLSQADSGVKLADGGPVMETFRSRMSALTDAGKLPKTPLGKTTFGDAFREATVVAESERRLGISALPLRRFASFYEPKVLAREEHTVCDLVANYDVLSSDLRRSREVCRFPIARYITAEIPPLPVLALARASDRGGLLRTVLELREEYEPMRRSLSDLRSTLADEAVPLKEKQRQLRSWSRSWRTLDRYGSSKLVLANAPNAVIDVDKSIDGAFLDLNLNKLVERIFKEAASGFYKWRVRFLHDTAKQYLRSSDDQIATHTKRLFGHELSADDLRELEAWDARIASMVDTSSTDRGTVH